MADKKYYYATGKRKTATAKVRLHDNGTGKIIINTKTIDEYVSVVDFRKIVKSPLALTNMVNKFDISIFVNGGGIKGQSEAMRHGISKALLEFDITLRATLKKEGFLTRDPRKKERKKPGLKRARKASQFSKR